ncbi:MAG: tyrosine-type recombinase/integrase [Pyrinomonadaceae bacterium]|nr:tyrosine-type recombinase/integrase [Pyrinomonadaceae bacterium]
MDELLRARFRRYLDSLEPASFDQVIAYLQTLHARNYAPATLDAVTGAVKKFLLLVPAARRVFLSSNLAQTEPPDIDSFITAARDAALAPSTINNKLSLLREFFSFLIEEGAMVRQPVLRHRHHVAAPTTLPKPMSEVDLLRFFKVVDSLRDRLLFLLMLRCGLRVSEACALAWADVDLPALTLRIDGGKGDVDRVAYVAPDVDQALRLWQARRCGSPYLFPSRKVSGTHLGRRNVFMMMKKYLRVAGVTGCYSPHCLRHTFATQLLNAGVSLEVLKELMGHRSIQMTLRYTELYEITKRQQYTQAMGRITRQVAAGR